MWCCLGGAAIDTRGQLELTAQHVKLRNKTAPHSQLISAKSPRLIRDWAELRSARDKSGFKRSHTHTHWADTRLRDNKLVVDGMQDVRMWQSSPQICVWMEQLCLINQEKTNSPDLQDAVNLVLLAAASQSLHFELVNKRYTEDSQIVTWLYCSAICQ